MAIHHTRKRKRRNRHRNKKQNQLKPSTNNKNSAVSIYSSLSSNGSYGKTQKYLEKNIVTRRRIDPKMSEKLNIICNDGTWGTCVDFMYKDFICKFFDNYDIHSKTVAGYEEIADGQSGTVFRIMFSRHNFSSYAAIKHGKDSNDNLMYEYFVGKLFINKYINIYPCFVETYGFYHLFNDNFNDLKTVYNEFNNNITKLYELKDEIYKLKHPDTGNADAHATENKQDNNAAMNAEQQERYNELRAEFKALQKIIKKQYVDKTVLELKHMKNISNSLNSMNDMKEVAKKSCKIGGISSNAICMQFFKTVIPIDDYFYFHTEQLNFKYHNLKLEELVSHVNSCDFAPVLFQIYFVLHILRNIYTHYDLHMGNVLLYKPYSGKRYVVMHYNWTDSKTGINNVLSFPTEYITKIIDYGRNFFYVNEHINSNGILGSTCVKECEPLNESELSPETMCGETRGFYWIIGKTEQTISSHITPRRRNISHDLRLVSYLDWLFNIYNKVCNTNDFTVKYKTDYGTPERLNPSKTHRIVNVTHMFECLAKHMNSIFNTFSPLNKYTDEWIKMGDLHVYSDGRPYNFIPTHIHK